MELSDFTNVTEVGRGPHGVVYRARQLQPSREVAVKVLHRRVDGEARDRFVRDAATVTRLAGEHPVVLALYDFSFTAEGQPLLVMPFMGGGSLEGRLRRGQRLTWEQAAELGVHLAGALHSAHAAGLVHAGVKPANILFDTLGEPALADFGMPVAAQAAAPSSGGGPDPAGDVRALSSVLFTAVLGEPVAAGQMPPDLRPRGVPDGVARALEVGLASQAGDPRVSAADFGRELQAVQQAHGLEVAELRLLTGPAPPTAAAPVQHDSAPPRHPVDEDLANDRTTARRIDDLHPQGGTAPAGIPASPDQWSSGPVASDDPMWEARTVARRMDELGGEPAAAPEPAAGRWREPEHPPAAAPDTGEPESWADRTVARRGSDTDRQEEQAPPARPPVEAPTPTSSGPLPRVGAPPLFPPAPDPTETPLGGRAAPPPQPDVPPAAAAAAPEPPAAPLVERQPRPGPPAQSAPQGPAQPQGPSPAPAPGPYGPAPSGYGMPPAPPRPMPGPYGPPPGGHGPPPGGHGPPPGGHGPPPGGYGPPGSPGPAVPLGYPPGMAPPGGPPRRRSAAPLIIGVIVVLLLVGGGVGAVLLTRDGGSAVVSVTQAPTSPGGASTPTPTPTRIVPAPPPTLPPATPTPAEPTAPPTATAAPDGGDAGGEVTRQEVTETLEEGAVRSGEYTGRPGEEVVFVVLSTDFDPVLDVYDSQGNLLDSDDDSGGGDDALLRLNLPADGRVRLDVSSFFGGGGEYTLLANPGAAQIVDESVVYEGEDIVYTMTLLEGELLTISAPGSEGVSLEIFVVDEDTGEQLSSTDTGEQASLGYPIEQDGGYEVRIREVSGASVPFRIVIEVA